MSLFHSFYFISSIAHSNNRKINKKTKQRQTREEAKKYKKKKKKSKAQTATGVVVHR